MRFRYLLFLPVVVYGCRHNSTGQVNGHSRAAKSYIHASGQTIEQRFEPPPGYYREPQDEGSFGKYLRSLPLKKDGARVLYHDGREKENNGVYSAVVAMDIGSKDLQQCADAVMRLRAEYLYATGQSDKIHFNFTSGFRADYSKWKAGYRIAVNGNNVSWVRKAEPGSSYVSFRNYLDVVFSYAGTLSLSRELKEVKYKDLAIGDVLIQGGFPGHAVMVVDMAENNEGRKVYLLAQSYMPAQETQILNNPMNEDHSPWYDLDTEQTQIQTPQWKFSVYDVKRFED